jgi:hypothetical protein
MIKLVAFRKLNILHIVRADIKYLFLIWVMFTSTAPFEFYAMIPYHPYKALVMFIVIIMLMATIMKSIKITGDVIVLILIVQIVYSCFTILIHTVSLEQFQFDDGLAYINLAIQLIVVLISYIFIKRFFSIHKLAVSLIPIMIVIAALGMVILILGILANLQPFSSTVLIDHRYIGNYILTFSPGAPDYGIGRIIRSAGYFDEPGTFAFYLTITLLINRMYGYSKWAERWLIVLGVCTFSLAFFISVTLHLLLFGLLDKRIKLIIASVVIIGSLIFLINENRENSKIADIIYNLTIYRILPDDTVGSPKLFRGDNRSVNFYYAKKAFLEAPFFGHGYLAHTKGKPEYVGRLCCNPLHPLATEGIIGTFIFFNVLIYWGFYILRHKPFDFVSAVAWFIVFVNMLQRPGFSGGSFGYFVFIFLLQATKWRRMQL